MVKNLYTFKKVFTAFALVYIYLLVVFNIMLYSLARLMGINVDIIVLYIILLEIVCVLFGCYYSYLSIKNDKIKEYKEASALTISIISVFSGCTAILARRFAQEAPIPIQAFAFITIFSIGECIIAFYIGKIIIPMCYFIKRLNIDNFDFSNEQN